MHVGHFAGDLGFELGSHIFAFPEKLDSLLKCGVTVFGVFGARGDLLLAGSPVVLLIQ